MNRRNFIFGSAVGLVGATQLKSYSLQELRDSTYIESTTIPLKNVPQKTKIIPKALKSGSKIAITAPASPISEWQVREAVSIFKSLGCEVVIGDTIKHQTNDYRYFSASEDVRANELMNFVKDDSIDCIICGRGGYGVMRILDRIDFDLFAKHPKILIGFSDITALLNSIYNITGLVTYHGPVASSSFNKFTLDNFKKVLFTNYKDDLVFTHKNVQIINEGSYEGKLVGGNLKMIVSTLSTPFEIDTTDSILFLEDIDEHPYKIDRMLTQLKLAGKLDTVKAFVFGNFKGMDERGDFFPTKSYTLREVIEQIIVPYNKPILMNMPIGHISEKLTIPIGLTGLVDTKTKSLSLLENPVT